MDQEEDDEVAAEFEEFKDDSSDHKAHLQASSPPFLFLEGLEAAKSLRSDKLS